MSPVEKILRCPGPRTLQRPPRAKESTSDDEPRDAGSARPRPTLPRAWPPGGPWGQPLARPKTSTDTRCNAFTQGRATLRPPKRANEKSCMAPAKSALCRPSTDLKADLLSYRHASGASQSRKSFVMYGFVSFSALPRSTRKAIPSPSKRHLEPRAPLRPRRQAQEAQGPAG